MSDPVKAVNFRRTVTDIAPGNLWPETTAFYRAELSNGRQLLIDDAGIIDPRDTGKTEAEAYDSAYLTWATILEAVDLIRQRVGN